MKKTFIILFLFFNSTIFSQEVEYLHIYNDTSLYFIHQIDSLHPVTLSLAELAETEEHLVKAINEFNRSQQRYADSVNPGKKKRKYHALQLDIMDYFFRLVPLYNKQNQKEVRLSGDIKEYFMTGKRKKPSYDPEWKRKFIKGNEVLDGGHLLFT